jgi:hypothetical protein
VEDGIHLPSILDVVPTEEKGPDVYAKMGAEKRNAKATSRKGGGMSKMSCSSEPSTGLRRHVLNDFAMSPGDAERRPIPYHTYKPAVPGQRRSREIMTVVLSKSRRVERRGSRRIPHRGLRV